MMDTQQAGQDPAAKNWLGESALIKLTIIAVLTCYRLFHDILSARIDWNKESSAELAV